MKTNFSLIFICTLFLWAGTALAQYQDTTSASHNMMHPDSGMMAMMEKQNDDCNCMHKMHADMGSMHKRNQKTNSVHRGHMGHSLSDKESEDSGKAVTHPKRYNPKYPFRK